MNFNTVVLRMLLSALAFYGVCSAETLRYHTLVVDGQNKIIPWFTPATNAFLPPIENPFVTARVGSIFAANWAFWAHAACKMSR